MTTGTITDFFPQARRISCGVVRLGLQARIYSGGTPDKSKVEYWEDGDIPWIGSGAVNQGTVTQPTAHITRQAVDNSSTRLFSKNSLIMALAGQGKTKGMVAQMGIDAYGNQSLGCISNYQGERRFLFWWLTSLYREIRNLSSGETRDGLNQSMLGQIPVPLLDLATQCQIADFLDRETARIDLLIEKKRRLVELLEEKYEATARQLGTGKLTGEPKAESGIDWLGAIPQSWRIEKLVWHFAACKGRDAQKYTKEYCAANEGAFPVYSGQTANEGVMGLINTYDYDFGMRGVLFATTVGAKAMDLRHLQGKFSLSQNCMIIVPRRAIPIKFFLYQMRVLFQKERQLIPDHMQASFRVEDLYRYRIAVPPLDQANEIGHKIENAEAMLRTLTLPVITSIDRLKEYRSALITAAVTGQVDVTTCSKSGTTDRRLDAIQEEMGA